MEAIHYRRCSEKEELEEILALQRQNLPASLSEEEKEIEGFVTVSHRFELLSRMNNRCPHIIAKCHDRVVGYALCMHPSFGNEIAVLRSMFTQLQQLAESKHPYMVMGQICIARQFRKKSVFRGLYQFMREELKSNYNSIITEVDSRNQRSLKAHYHLGFFKLLTHSSGGRLWPIIIWPIGNNSEDES